MSIDFWVEELTHDINPEHFNHHENFIPYMHDEKIGSFGNWMWNNGYNVGLYNLQTKLSCEQEWISVKDKLPTFGVPVMVTTGYWGDKPDVCTAQLWVDKDGDEIVWKDYYGDDVELMMGASVTHWKTLPEKPEEEDNDETTE